MPKFKELFEDEEERDLDKEKVDLDGIEIDNKKKSKKKKEVDIIDIKAIELRMALYHVSGASLSLSMKDYWKRLKEFVNTHKLVETSNRNYVLVEK